jgi:hypothetical protein
MKLTVQSPVKAINKAYLKQRGEGFLGQDIHVYIWKRLSCCTAFYHF